MEWQFLFRPKKKKKNTNIEVNHRSYGAQFDIQEEDVTFQNVNSTGAYVIYYSEFEYSDASNKKIQRCILYI